MDTRFILSTSNLCERLFSLACYTLNDRRRQALPAHIESQLFLHFNQDYWGIRDVHCVLMSHPSGKGNYDGEQAGDDAAIMYDVQETDEHEDLNGDGEAGLSVIRAFNTWY